MLLHFRNVNSKYIFSYFGSLLFLTSQVFLFGMSKV